MAKLRHEYWSLTLENDMWSTPLKLQHDLRLTRVIVMPGRIGYINLHVDLCVDYKNANLHSTKEKYYDAIPLYDDIDRLIYQGETVIFKANGVARSCVRCVKIEGHFEAPNDTLEKEPTPAECHMAAKWESTVKQLSQSQTTQSLINTRMTSLLELDATEPSSTKQYISDQLTKDAVETRDQLAGQLSAAMAEQARQVTACVKDLQEDMIKKVGQQIQLWQSESVGQIIKQENEKLHLKYNKIKEENKQMKVYIKSLERLKRKQKALIEELEGYIGGK